MVVDGIRAEVPSISCVFSHLQAKYGLEFGDLLMCDEFGVVHTKVRVVVRMDMSGDFLMWGIVVDLEVGRLDARVGNPVIIALIEVLEVHVVAV